MRSRAESIFDQWLKTQEAERDNNMRTLLSGKSQGLRSEVERMIADYHRLRNRLGDGAPAFEAGRLLGDYRLVRELGRGAMGVVWEAEQTSMGRRVALKLLLPHFNLSDTARERFRREAKAGGKLSHPGVVQVYALGEVDGVHFIAQELIPGGYTLADSLAELREEEKLPEGIYRELAQMFVAITKALDSVHTQGVVHRDIKPANILLDDDNQPRIADFGLAWVEDSLGLSRTGDFLGTPYYMSPEQAAAKRIGIDYRTDIFSVGVTLYEALTLQRPFNGDTRQQVLEKILLDEPLPPRKVRSRVPRDLSVIALKAMEKNRERRYGTMAEFADDLQRFLDSRPILAKPPGPLRRVAKWTRRHPVASVAMGLVATTGGIVTLLMLALLSSDRQKEAAIQLLQDKTVQLGEAKERERQRAESETARAIAEGLRAEVEAGRAAVESARADLAARRTYAAQLRTAEVLLEEGRITLARDHLDTCAEQLRGWEWQYLQRELNGVRILNGPASVITAVAANPQGEWLATGDQLGVIRIWDLAKGIVLTEMDARRDSPVPIRSLAIHPGMARLAIGLENGTLIVWGLSFLRGEDESIGRIESIWTIDDLVWESDPVTQLLMDDAWNLIAATTAGSTISWSYRKTTDPTDYYDPSEHRLPSRSLTQTPTTLLAPELAAVTAVAISMPPGETKVALGNASGTVSVIDIGFSMKTVGSDLRRPRVSVLAIALSNSDQLVAASYADGSGMIWDSVTLDELVTLDPGPEPADLLTFQPSTGQLHALASASGDVWSWDVASGHIASTRIGHPGSAVALAVLPNDGGLLTAGSDGQLLIWPSSPASSTRIAGDQRFTSVAFSPDGQQLLAGCMVDGSESEPSLATSTVRVLRHPRPLRSLTLDPNSTQLHGGSRSQGWLSWSNHDNTDVASYVPVAGGVYSLALSPNGQRLITGSYEGSVQIWDAHTKEPLARLLGTEDGGSSIVPVAWSPAGSLLAAGTFDGAVRVWSTASVSEPQPPLLALRGHERHVVALAFSVDGTQLASASNDGTVRLWNPHSGELVTVMRRHLGRVAALAFHPGGERLASVGRDDFTVHLWDTRTGESLWTFENHRAAVTAVVFDPSGRQLATASYDGTVRVWDAGGPQPDPPLGQK